MRVGCMRVLQHLAVPLKPILPMSRAMHEASEANDATETHGTEDEVVSEESWDPEAGHEPNQGDEPEMEDEPNETSHEARHMTPQEPAYPPPPPAIRPGPPLVWWHGGVYIERYETGSFRIYEEVDGEWVDMRLSEDDLETMRQIATRAMRMMTQASEVELLSWLQQLIGNQAMRTSVRIALTASVGMGQLEAAAGVPMEQIRQQI